MDSDISTVVPFQTPDRHRLRMAVSLGPEHLSYAIYDPLADSDSERLRYTDIRLHRSQLTEFPEVNDLEDAVYSHPSMLADYGRVDVSIDTRELLLTPAEADSRLAESMADATMSADVDKILAETHGKLCDASAWLRLPATLDAFIRRTFNTPRYHHPMVTMARCYCVDTTTPSPVINLHFFGNRGLYIVIRRDNRLLLANSFEVRADSDALYYTLAAINAVGLTAADVRVRTSGHAERRQSASTMLADSFDDIAPASLPAPLLREGPAILPIPVELSSLLLL
ncbi:MAG: DUF3822 family protein [Muribaculum sp.]|nr:DUF3822 family protein [Muribaculum sp.]